MNTSTSILTGYDESTLSILNEETFQSMFEKYLDPIQLSYEEVDVDDVMATQPAEDVIVIAPQPGLPDLDIFKRLPWFTCIRDIFDSSSELTKVRSLSHV
jgi:hypothetical protein